MNRPTLALSLGLLAACSGASNEQDAVITIDTTQHGDTVLITTHRPAALDTVTLLVSDLALDQPFGQILSIAVSAMIVDVSGRIWLRRTSESIRIELPPKDPDPMAFPDVPYVERARYLGFSSDGAFLGELELPLGIGGTSFVKDHVWMSRRTPDGEMVVSRYRIPWE